MLACGSELRFNFLNICFDFDLMSVSSFSDYVLPSQSARILPRTSDVLPARHPQTPLALGLRCLSGQSHECCAGIPSRRAICVDLTIMLSGNRFGVVTRLVLLAARILIGCHVKNISSASCPSRARTMRKIQTSDGLCSASQSGASYPSVRILSSRSTHSSCFQAHLSANDTRVSKQMT